MSKDLVATTPCCANCGGLTPMAFVTKGTAKFLCIECYGLVEGILKIMGVDFQYICISW